MDNDNSLRVVLMLLRQSRQERRKRARRKDNPDLWQAQRNYANALYWTALELLDVPWESDADPHGGPTRRWVESLWNRKPPLSLDDFVLRVLKRLKRMNRAK